MLKLHTNWIFSVGSQFLTAWWHRVQCMFFSLSLLKAVWPNPLLYNQWKTLTDMYFNLVKKPLSAQCINPKCFANVTFVPSDFPKRFYSSAVKTLEALYLPCLTLSLPPSPSSIFLSLGSLPSEAFDWKHALFNHWGDSPCPVFAPLPRCNNKGRVTLSVSSRRDVWRRERGKEWKKEREKRGRAEGREGGKENESRNWRGEEKLRKVLRACQAQEESTTPQQKLRDWFKVNRIQEFCGLG